MKSNAFTPGAAWKVGVVLVGVTLLIAASAYLSLRTVGEVLQGTARAGPRGFGGPEDALDAVTRCCRFEVVDWEVQHLVRLVTSRLLTPSPKNVRQEDLNVVRQFFALTRDIARTEFSMNRSERAGPQPELSELVTRLKHERDRLKPKTGRVLATLVSQYLAKEGLALPLPFQEGVVVPPVVFTWVRPPSVLAISPRAQIRLERSTVLQPGLSDQQALQMEAEAEALGWSSVVEPTGGYSTYPPIVSDVSSLEGTLQAVAHEWVHTYLFLRPLGFHYFNSQEMRTINETAADIVGREVGWQLLGSIFGSPRPATPDRDRPLPFNFRQEMRQTRLEAGRRLDEGKIEEAEVYMEERRQLFVRQGYNIRKLNQAYFAFHGTYGDSPASISPIGPQLEALFQRKGSVGQFLKALEGVASFQDYQRLLAAYGVP